MQTHMFLKQTKEWIIQPQLFSSKTGRAHYANKHFRSQSESSITLCLFSGKSWSSLSLDSLIFFFYHNKQHVLAIQNLLN